MNTIKSIKDIISSNKHSQKLVLGFKELGSRNENYIKIRPNRYVY